MEKKLLEYAIMEEEYLKVNIFTHPLAPFREDLKKLGFITSKELSLVKRGSKVKVAGRVILIHTPPTKTGVRIMFVTAEDEYGLLDLVLLPQEQKKYSRTLLLNSLCCFEGEIKKYGRGSFSITIERIIPLEDALKGTIDLKNGSNSETFQQETLLNL